MFEKFLEIIPLNLLKWIDRQLFIFKNLYLKEITNTVYRVYVKRIIKKG